MDGGLSSLDDFDDDIKTVTIRFIMTNGMIFEREKGRVLSSEDVLFLAFFFVVLFLALGVGWTDR